MSFSYDAVFNDSYARITDSDNGERFFNHFYQLFVHSTAEIEATFLEQDEARIRKIVYKTFFYMLSVSSTHNVSNYLINISRTQDAEGIKLPPAFYAHWRRAILETVRRLDPDCDEEIITAWAMVIAPGLEYVRRQAELFHVIAPPAVPGTTP